MTAFAPNRRRWLSNRVVARAGVYVLLAVVTWGAFFLRCREFGLYEDDYYFTGLTMGMAGGEVAGDAWRSLYSPDNYLARPLGLAIPRLLSYAGNRVAGLQGVYFIGFLIVVANTVLVYHVLQRVAPATLALFGALVFSLFPADTTKALLTHALQLQVSVTFVLVASLLWLSGRRVISYIVVLGTLLTYESAILPFFLVPFLQRKWDRRLVRAWALHVAVLVVLIVACAAARRLRGEPRVTDITLVDCAELVWGLGLGPAVSASALVAAPGVVVAAIVDGELDVLLALGLASALLYVVLRYAARPKDEGSTSVSLNWRGKLVAGRGVIEAPQALLDAVRVFAVGLVMMPLAYVMAFTHYPLFPLRGRSTSVHLAASVAMACALGALLYMLYRFLHARRSRTLGTLAIAVYLGSLVAYGVHHQHEYVRSRDSQRRMFTSIVRQCPDLTEGTLILVEGSRLSDSPCAMAYSWSCPIVLEQVLRFPADWERPPRVFVVADDWARHLEVEDGRCRWFMPAALWPAQWIELPQGNVIVFRLVDGELVRRSDPVVVDGIELQLKQIPVGDLPRYPKGHLYDLLVNEAFADSLPTK